jgi:hypothetical protein
VARASDRAGTKDAVGAPSLRFLQGRVRCCRYNFLVLSNPHSACVRGSRPLQSAQRTGHPLWFWCRYDSKAGPPVLRTSRTPAGPATGKSPTLLRQAQSGSSLACTNPQIHHRRPSNRNDIESNRIECEGSDMGSNELATHRTVRCSRHGDSREAFLCEHLLRGNALGFFFDADDASNPYPDAWCSSCECVRAESGEFSDDYALATFKLVCGGCYEEIKAKNALGPEHSPQIQ